MRKMCKKDLGIAYPGQRFTTLPKQNIYGEKASNKNLFIAIIIFILTTIKSKIKSITKMLYYVSFSFSPDVLIGGNIYVKI